MVFGCYEGVLANKDNIAIFPDYPEIPGIVRVINEYSRVSADGVIIPDRVTGGFLKVAQPLGAPPFMPAISNQALLLTNLYYLE